MEWVDLVRNQSKEWKTLAKREGVKGRYTRITLDLATAQTNAELAIEGDYIGVANITSTGTCQIRLDHRHSQNINLREVSEIASPFGKIYFTTDGAGGECNVYIGGALTARLKPLQSKVSIRNIAGSDVDLVTDSRFISHTGGHAVCQIVADTAKKATAASKKVKWALLYTDKAIRWGFTSTIDRTTPIGVKVAANGTLVVEYCDLTTLYLINDVAVETPLIQIEYVEEA